MTQTEKTVRSKEPLSLLLDLGLAVLEKGFIFNPRGRSLKKAEGACNNENFSNDRIWI